MGRTYKKNDLHRSRRPKSIREKRNFSNKKTNSEFDNYDSPKHQKSFKDYTNLDYTIDDEWWTMMCLTRIGLMTFCPKNPMISLLHTRTQSLRVLNPNPQEISHD